MRFTKQLKQSLVNCLTDPIEKFSSLGHTIETKNGPATYIDNGSDIIAAGHLDWVYFNPQPKIDWRKRTVTQCPQLDDRLGVWVLLHLLPAIDPTFKFDIILCDSEETGNSTGQHYPFQKNYRWGFEFDRAGVDCVNYEYSDKSWDLECQNLAELGSGAFSDISYLEHLNCKMVNVGVGYYSQHTRHCYAKLNETISMAQKFVQWANVRKNVKYPHTKNNTTWGGPYGFYDDSDDVNECEFCFCETDQSWLCSDCQLQIVRGTK